MVSSKFLCRQSEEETEESGTTEHPFYHYLSEYEDYEEYEEYPNAYNDYQTGDDNDTSDFPHVIDETGFLFSSPDDETDFIFGNETTEYQYQ